MRHLNLFWITLAAALLHPAAADERTLTPEQMEALAKQGELDVEDAPSNLLNFIKGDLPPTGKSAPTTWTLGPTGIIGVMNHKQQGTQFLVQGTLKGSPSDGKFQRGDVLIGLNGKPFSPTDLGVLIGNGIIDAEREENAGKISFLVWRDKNYVARSGKQDVVSVDIDKIFQETSDDDSLYDWKAEEERAEEVKQMGFDKYPLDPVNLEIGLTLRTFPDYADTAPYDCPKTRQILEDAWKALEKKFIADPTNPRSGRGGIIEAMALVASGKPEHRELVREWVRSKNSPWKPPVDPPGTMFEPGYKGYKGYQSWHHGFNGLYCALYYEATGDDYVLPALRKYAIDTALGQSALGSWGHTFAYPSFNGGEFHKMNPGYGALNAAGNRCFFLIVLAKKLGIEHPEIDLAIERGRKFFGSYVDQGCIPYGDHGAYGSDDSNGKNTGIAFGLKLLGDKHGAKYFAMMSSHCAFTRRGGHGHDYHGNWSSWAASLCGPKVRAYNERNLRWRRTLCRMYDGSFVYASPTGSYGTLRDPTATEVFHQAAFLKQTLITGKDADEDLYPTEREIKQLLTSARNQLNDPWLIEKSGTPWAERSTEEIIDLLDIFYPKARASFATELGKRYQAGEKDIPARLVELLGSEEPRFRDGALRALGACGSDVVLESLSKITSLLNDPEDFIRITAVKVVSAATASEDAQLAMLQASVDEPKAIEPNAVRNATQTALFAKETPLANKPFDAGFDNELVEEALENLILLDPVGSRGFLSSRKGKWDKDTIVRLAGPLTYAAEEEQLGDQMFANRAAPAQAILGSLGYREGLEATAHRLRKQAVIARHVRPYVGFKRPLMDPEVVKKQPAAFTGFIPHLETVLTDNPLARLEVKIDKKVEVTNLDELYELILPTRQKPDVLPSIATDVATMFEQEINALEGTGAKLKLCRDALKDPARKNTFRKLTAMDHLVEALATDAMEDLVPYLAHSDWRLRERSRNHASELVRAGGAAQLVESFSSTPNSRTAAGILETFAMSGAEAGKAVARQALDHDSPEVRQAALHALAKLEGIKALDGIIAHIKKSETPEDLCGSEDALLILAEDPKLSDEVRDAVIAILPDVTPEVRASAYYIIARIGDDASIAALRKAGKTDSKSEFNDLVRALSYSSSREADKVLLEFAATDKNSAKVVGEHAVRRMVLGPKGFWDVTDAERMDFAEPMIKMAMDKGLVSYLGRIHNARALRSLMYCLENGVSSAAESLIFNAETTEKFSESDAKIAAESLQDVIEYIEVTHLRGGIQAHMNKDDKYIEWKALQARGGKVLLKVHQPGKAPIPTFDDLELDP